MEGAEGLRSIDELDEFYELGLRQVGPVWAGMRYCGGSKETRSFDSEGFSLLEKIASLGMAMDISHMSESAALTALDHFDGPVLASHSNARSLLKGRPPERHLSDQTIRAFLISAVVLALYLTISFYLPTGTSILHPELLQ